jgi:hypothetical protein
MTICVLFLMHYVMHTCLVTLRSAHFAPMSLFSWICCDPHRIEVDQDKVEAIHSCPVPTTVTQVRSFIGLASFYCRFVKEFCTIAAPLHEVTKKGATFTWATTQQDAFDTPVAYLSKKLSGPSLNYSIYDKELLALI